MPDEQRAKISAALMGHSVSLEARAKSSAANTGRHHTPEECAKISTAQMGRSNPSAIGNTYRRGTHLSDEARARDSAAHIGLRPSPETRQKMSIAQTGRRATIKTRAKLSLVAIGNKNGLGPRSIEVREKMSLAQRGHSVSPEARVNNAVAHWRGGPLASIRRRNAKRRTLGFVPLNKPFLGCEGHHVDGEQVIYMPKELHQSIYHRQTDGRGMAKINAVAYNFLFKQEVEAAMGAQSASE
jgi:hypothetical protein